MPEDQVGVSEEKDLGSLTPKDNQSADDQSHEQYPVKEPKVSNDYQEEQNKRNNEYPRNRLVTMLGNEKKRDFSSRPLTKKDLGAIAKINGGDQNHEVGDHYTEQMQGFIASFHKDLPEKYDRSSYNEVMQLVKSHVENSTGKKAKLESKKSHEYFQDFLTKASSQYGADFPIINEFIKIIKTHNLNMAGDVDAEQVQEPEISDVDQVDGGKGSVDEGNSLDMREEERKVEGQQSELSKRGKELFEAHNREYNPSVRGGFSDGLNEGLKGAGSKPFTVEEVGKISQPAFDIKGGKEDYYASKMAKFLIGFHKKIPESFNEDSYAEFMNMTKDHLESSVKMDGAKDSFTYFQGFLQKASKYSQDFPAIEEAVHEFGVEFGKEVGVDGYIDELKKSLPDGDEVDNELRVLDDEGLGDETVVDGDKQEEGQQDRGDSMDGPNKDKSKNKVHDESESHPVKNVIAAGAVGVALAFPFLIPLVAVGVTIYAYKRLSGVEPSETMKKDFVKQYENDYVRDAVGVNEQAKDPTMGRKSAGYLDSASSGLAGIMADTQETIKSAGEGLDKAGGILEDIVNKDKGALEGHDERKISVEEGSALQESGAEVIEVESVINTDPLMQGDQLESIEDIFTPIDENVVPQGDAKETTSNALPAAQEATVPSGIERAIENKSTVAPTTSVETAQMATAASPTTEAVTGPATERSGSNENGEKWTTRVGGSKLGSAKGQSPTQGVVPGP